jgi:hypothetical protein
MPHVTFPAYVLLVTVATETDDPLTLLLSEGSFSFIVSFPFPKLILLVYSTSADSESILLQVLTLVTPFSLPG